MNVVSVCLEYSNVFKTVLRQRRFKNLNFRNPVAVRFSHRNNLANMHDSWQRNLQVLPRVPRLV